MKTFTLYWLKGISELVSGIDIYEAINSVSKKGKVVYYTEGDSRLNYEYNKEYKAWMPNDGIEYNLEFCPLEVSDDGKDKDGFTIRSFFIDDSGLNKLMVKQNNKLCTLILKLGSTKNRLVGTVTKSTRTIEMKRVKDKHLFIKINGYGFNHYILKNQTSIDWIRLSDDTGSHWKIPVKFVLEKGKYYYFKKQGFELQQFVSLNDLKPFLVREEENRRF